MENKKTFSNFKLLLETKNIGENDSINIFNSQKLLNSYFKKIIFEDFYWNISIKSNVQSSISFFAYEESETTAAYISFW